MNSQFVSGMTLGVVLSILVIICDGEVAKYLMFTIGAIGTGLVCMWLERKVKDG